MPKVDSGLNRMEHSSIFLKIQYEQQRCLKTLLIVNSFISWRIFVGQRSWSMRIKIKAFVTWESFRRRIFLIKNTFNYWRKFIENKRTI